MGKVIILEGPDGSGKTTLAEFLKQNDFVYKHEGPPPPNRDQLEYYKCTLFDALESKHNVVFDRLFLGETIYGPVIRGVDNLGKDGAKLFERILASQTVHQYICMPSEHTLRNNYLKKMQDKSDYVGGMTNFKKIVNLYYSKILRPYTRLYDYEADSPQTVLDEPFQPALPKGTIGSRDAKHLFIADVPNHPYVDWPFFSVTNSSGYFNKVLEILNIEEKDMALSNAYGPNEEEHDPLAICNAFPNLKHIILMGNKAQEWFVRKVNAANVKVHFLPHPSYMKRFKGSDPKIFVEEIRREIWHS